MSAIVVAFANNHRTTVNRVGIISLIVARPFVYVVGIVIFILIALQLVISNYLATKGGQLAVINQQVIQIQNENIQLKADVAKKSSLLNIEKEAQLLGMEKATNHLYVNQAIPFALK